MIIWSLNSVRWSLRVSPNIYSKTYCTDAMTVVYLYQLPLCHKPPLNNFLIFSGEWHWPAAGHAWRGHSCAAAHHAACSAVRLQTPGGLQGGGPVGRLQSGTGSSSWRGTGIHHSRKEVKLCRFNKTQTACSRNLCSFDSYYSVLIYLLYCNVKQYLALFNI